MTAVQFRANSAIKNIILNGDFEDLVEPIKFAKDAPLYDFDLVTEMLINQKVTIENLEKKGQYFTSVLIENKIEKYFKENPDAYRHNAFS